MKLTPEESRVLRKQVHGKGNLERLGLIVVTDAGREFVRQDDDRIRQDKIKAGEKGGPARADSLSKKDLVRIATKGSRAARRARKEREQ